MLNSVIDLKSFYPEDLSIVDVEDKDERITIYMHSTSTACTCHRCGALLRKHHGSHHRVVQDLPILGKQVMLDCRSMTMRVIVKPANHLLQLKHLMDSSTIIAG